MKNVSLITAFLIVFSFFTTSLKAQTNSNSICIGVVDSINSKILNEKRRVLIHVPKGEGKKFPVLYVLDGDDHFEALVGMMKRLNSTENCPEMIVVGISNSNRNRSRDLTSTKADDPRFGLRNTGGGDKFMAFIEKELIPKIESNYPTAPYRIFIGHSAGGLLVMNTLLKQNNLFNAYVAIDPGMLHDNKKLLQESKKILKENTFENKSLFLGISNSMEVGMDTLTVRKDSGFNSMIIRPILETKDVLISSKSNQLNFDYKYYADDDHRSVAFLAEYDAIRFFFKDYKFKMRDSYLTDSNSNLSTILEVHYKKVSMQLGYVINPDEDLVNNFAYSALGEKQLDKAGDLFKLNVSNYPKSANAFDSLGDYYLEIKDNANAIANFKKSLELKEVPQIREKLEKLLKEVN
jgi:predicted alpha/beta superfamily hydrolase